MTSFDAGQNLTERLQIFPRRFIKRLIHLILKEFVVYDKNKTALVTWIALVEVLRPESPRPGLSIA